MANIRDLVPDIDLCLKAKMLGWQKDTWMAYTKYTTYARAKPKHNPWLLMRSHRVNDHYFIINTNAYAVIYAPTLQEVLEELPIWAALEKDIDVSNKMTYRLRIDNEDLDFIEPITHPNPAEAALALWCTLEEMKLKES